MIDRMMLGRAMMHWHGGQDDPVYAVASFYVDDRTYPKRRIVREALSNLESDLYKFERMQRGESVKVRRYGREVELRAFAGYTDRAIAGNVRQLTRITRALRRIMRQDYPKKEATT